MKSTKEKRGLRTDEVMVRLRDRFHISQGWAFFANVADAAGFSGQRYADAVAMHTWPSRGLEVHGIEVKVSRSDWQRELKNPAKSAPVQKYCDRWWVVVGEAEIIHDGELPPTWGLIVPRGESLRVKVEAPQLTAEPLTKSFIGALLRRASESNLDENALRDAESRGYQKGLASVKAEEDRWEKRYDALMADVREFENAAGVRLKAWRNTPAKVGAALALILKDEHKLDDSAKQALANILSTHEQAIHAIKSGLELLG